MDEINDYILEIGAMLISCDDMLDSEWNQLSIIFDIDDGHIANSGFLYQEDEIIPVTADQENDPLLPSNKVKHFCELVRKEFGNNVMQLLIQMEQKSGRIKVEFEFDDPQRWSITPANIGEMQEQLRPSFVTSP